MTKVQMGVHIGRALEYVTQNYPTLNKVVLELIQNSLDSESTEIWVYVNYEKRALNVRDNGAGIAQEKFAKAIQSVCSSIKSEGKLGQFGIGLMSPLGKCQEFVITSSPRPNNKGYHRWTLNSADILENSDFSEIPEEKVTDLIFSQTMGKIPNQRPVNWHTEVALHNFTKDKSINAIATHDLRIMILGQFSEAMKRLGTTVSITLKPAGKEEERINFQAADFEGEKMDTVQFGDKKNGQTTFEIWISPKTKEGRKGQIQIGIKFNDFRIPLSTFAKSITGLVSQETLSVLTSGTFEGSIISDRCTLHPDRKQFQENESLMDFCLHLDAWAKHYGLETIIKMKDSQKDVWLQALGSVAMSNLEEKIRGEMQHLLPVIKNFKIGTIGTGHVGYCQSKKEKPNTSMQITGQNNGEASEPTRSSSKGTGGKRDSGHPGHIPFAVSGPKGSRRRLVKGHSTGIQFIYEEMPGSDNHWEFDPDDGSLTFNIRSDIWEKMERHGERNLILYQEYVAIKALEMQLEPPACRPSIYEFLQRELKSAAIFIISSTNLQPRKAKAEVGKRLNRG